MKLRAPATPLITIDPYFSVWSMGDKLNETDTKHWTGKPHKLTGYAIINEKTYCFMGVDDNAIKMKQASVDINALSTKYTFICDEITLDLIFTSPLLLDNLYIASRPVSYLKVIAKSIDNMQHDILIKIIVDDELCLDSKAEYSTIFSQVNINNIQCAKVGSTTQNVLSQCGDDLRINWGYLYVATNAKTSKISNISYDNANGNKSNDIEVSANINTSSENSALFVFAYDDIKALEYFGEHIDAYWKKNGDSIEDVVVKSFNDYDNLFLRCEEFSQNLYNDAVESGSEKYADLLNLAYRQAIAAHKICVDTNGEILFVSKECFSNGCAATVDVTYPSIPLFLLYNPELVKGMLRPIFKYANGNVWCFDFAPHDAGTYPILNGQVYSQGIDPEHQMPVEECGNMLVATASVAIVQNDISFAKENWDLLKKWTDYLVEHGVDPENQLCTDDFAGHLAHNCNLSIKATMGIVSFSILCKMMDNIDDAEKYMAIAKRMGKKWIELAANNDGTYKLAFDRPDTFSMKYNIVWDKLFSTEIYPQDEIKSEYQSYINKRINKYGMPLDNRADYTKSDWLVWCATLSDNKGDFIKMIEPLWSAYNESESRVPMTDWYDTLNAKIIGFQNRTVQGGLFIKLLYDKKICEFN